MSYYPWELLDVVKNTYRSTGIETPPTIDIKGTVSLSARGTPEWWTMGNAIGLPALHEMINSRHSSELSGVIAEVNLLCHLLVHRWRRSVNVTAADIEQFHVDFCAAIRYSSHEFTDSFVYGTVPFKTPAQLGLSDPLSEDRI